MIEKIKSNEYALLYFFIIRSFFIGIGFYCILSITNQESWLTMIIGFLLGLIPFTVFYLIHTHDTSLSINGLAKKSLGKIIGTIANILLVLFVILHASIILWNISNFISSQYLYRTPDIVIAILFLIPAIYAVFKGLKTIGRASVIFFLIGAVLFVMTAFSLFKLVEIHDLMPLFEHSTGTMFKGSLSVVAYNMLPLAIFLIIPKDNVSNNKKLTKMMFISYCVGFLTIIIAALCTIGIFGTELSNMYIYPEFHLLKAIDASSFFQRIESIVAIQWLFDLLIALIMFIFFIKSSLKETFNIKDKIAKFIPIVVGIILLLILHYGLNNNVLVYDFLKQSYPTICICFMFGIPLIILIVSKIRKKT